MNPPGLDVNLFHHFDSGSGDTALAHQIVPLLTLILAKVTKMSSTLDTSIAALVADNVALKAAVDAAPAEIATLIAAAIAKAIGAGATPAQLQAMSDLHTALSGDVSQLQAALAGTPPVVPPAPAPTVPGATA